MTGGVIEYRPNVWLGLFLAATNLVAVPILIWIGMVLGPESVKAMDGFPRVLFSVVPIPFFSWLSAVVFLFLGLLIAKRSLRSDPTLVISEGGLRLPSGEEVPWSGLEAYKLKKQELVLTVRRVGETSEPDSELTPVPWWAIWKRFARDPDRSRWSISSFEVGSDLLTVFEEIERRANVASE